MIIEVEDRFGKTAAQFLDVLAKLEEAAERDDAVHEVEETTWGGLLEMGRRMIGDYIEMQSQHVARPEVIEGTEELIPATALIFAFGYRPSPPQWLQSIGVDTDDSGLVSIVKGAPGQTSNPAIFAAGDMVRGSDLVVTAIADARATAESIIDYLETRQPQLKRA